MRPRMADMAWARLPGIPARNGGAHQVQLLILPFALTDQESRRVTGRRLETRNGTNVNIKTRRPGFSGSVPGFVAPAADSRQFVLTAAWDGHHGCAPFRGGVPVILVSRFRKPCSVPTLAGQGNHHGGPTMLVLGRKPGESIKIGDDIIVEIISNNRGQIRIGIEAPKNVPIVRTELEGRETKQRTQNP